jgi:histidinol-phosphate aminotransferase
MNERLQNAATGHGAKSAGKLLAFNPHVSALPVYNAGMNVAVARARSGRTDIARLASNENPDGCSPQVMAALRSAAFEPWRYADPACAALRDELAAHLHVGAGEIVVGNGSEEMIAAISRAILVEGTTVVTVSPSFGLHEIEPLAMGATVVKTPMTDDLGFDIDGLVDALAEGPRIVFVSSPWNPVGPALDRRALDKLVAALAPQTLFVLDEAYFEFADPDIPDGVRYLRESGVAHIVLRTLSKAYGLAGLRVGYAVCSDAEIARVVAAAKPPFNVNAAAQLAAIAALKDVAWMRNSVARTRDERARVSTALTELDLRVANSQTNFVFFETVKDSSELAAVLLSDGIIVKPWRETGYERFIRATIGTPAENSRLIEALTNHLRR